MNRLGRFDDRGRPPSTSIRTLRRENSFSLIDTTMPASSGRNAPERHLNFAEGCLFHIAATPASDNNLQGDGPERADVLPLFDTLNVASRPCQWPGTVVRRDRTR